MANKYPFLANKFLAMTSCPLCGTALMDISSMERHVWACSSCSFRASATRPKGRVCFHCDRTARFQVVNGMTSQEVCAECLVATLIDAVHSHGKVIAGKTVGVAGIS